MDNDGGYQPSRIGWRGFAFIVASMLAMLVLIFVMSWARVGFAQGAPELGDIGFGHSAGHEDYQSWKSPDTGISCCNKHDCRPTKARHDGENWWAVIDRVWTKIPNEKVLQEPSKDGIAHVCASAAKVIFCFRPPGGQT